MGKKQKSMWTEVTNPGAIEPGDILVWPEENKTRSPKLHVSYGTLRKIGVHISVDGTRGRSISYSQASALINARTTKLLMVTYASTNKEEQDFMSLEAPHTRLLFTRAAMLDDIVELNDILLNYDMLHYQNRFSGWSEKLGELADHFGGRNQDDLIEEVMETALDAKFSETNSNTFHEAARGQRRGCSPSKFEEVLMKAAFTNPHYRYLFNNSNARERPPYTFYGEAIVNLMKRGLRIYRPSDELADMIRSTMAAKVALSEVSTFEGIYQTLTKLKDFVTIELKSIKSRGLKMEARAKKLADIRIKTKRAFINLETGEENVSIK